MDLKKQLTGLAKSAAQVKVHKMPSMPEPKKGKDGVVPMSHSDYMKEKPRLRLNSVQMPGIKGMKDMKPDEECVLVVRAKVTGYSQEEYMKGEAEVTLEIHEIGVVPHKK